MFGYFMKEGPYPGFIHPEDFDEFTYSKNSHIGLFDTYNYDMELFRDKLDISRWSLKRYQDLLVFSFISQLIPEGSRLLDIGGGNSRIIAYFKNKYECWNIDKLEGCGHGPLNINTSGFHLVKDYIGNFNPALPDGYFDFVFSISALEHVPDKDPLLLQNILTDINRVLKPGCYSLHCFDCVLRPDRVWINKLLPYIFENENTINRFIPYEHLCKMQDIFVLPMEVYNEGWKRLIGKEYHEYGRPFSYNILWKKGGNGE
jgi:ubiquinone/menaquinone biosynthesis C-methylase UbiE